MPRIVPIKALKNTAEISQLCQSSDEPVFVTKNGYGSLVVMSIEAYEKYLAMSEIRAKVEEAERDISAGRIVGVTEAMEALREKHGI